MGKRKIPGKKHHGIRDPIKQAERRLAQIKDTINSPPEKDQQKLSYKLAQFQKLKNMAKSGKITKRNKNIGIEDKPKTRLKPMRPIKQLPSENDEDYLKRVNRKTYEDLKETEYEAKYGVDVIRNPMSGEISIKKRPKDELSTLKNKKQSIRSVAPKIPKDIIKEFLKKNTKKNEENIEEFKRDVVKFGEIIHGPPVLTTLPRKATKNDTVPRPGKKNNLLLLNILRGKEIGTTAEKIHSQRTELTKTTDLKGKRRELPLATRLMLEDQQSRAIQLYKQLKKNKAIQKT